MKADKTITLQLRAEDPATGATGDAYFEYAPNHAEYCDILRHVGPLSPGDEVFVTPWPEKETESSAADDNARQQDDDDLEFLQAPMEHGRWPTCTRQSMSTLRDWPHVTLQQAASGEFSGNRVNVEAIIRKRSPENPCDETSPYLHIQNCRLPYQTLEISDAKGEHTLEALAAYSILPFETGRRYEFSLRFCESATDAPAIEVLGFEPLDREPGGDTADCSPAGAQNWPDKPIESLAATRVLPGGFKTGGWVRECFKPRPCPPGKVCKPQPRPHVKLAASADGPAPFITLEGACGGRFVVGKHYHLAVALDSPRGFSYGGVNHGRVCAVY